MIDDEKDKVVFLEFIVDSLNEDNEIKKNEIVFHDGFKGKADKAHNNPTSLLEALSDKDGIYLVDLQMPLHSDTAVEIIESIKEKNESEYQKIVAIKEKIDELAFDELKNTELLDDHALSTTLLSICTNRRKPVIIVSSKAAGIRNLAAILAEEDFSKEDIKDYRIFNSPWPGRIIMLDKKEKKKILFKDLIKKIKEVALQNTYMGWEQFLAKVINFSTHEECEGAFLTLKNFLRLEDDTFKKYFENPDIPGTLSSFTSEAIKSIAGLRDNVELHAGWLIGLGVFRGLPGFMELDWSSIWKPEVFINLPENPEDDTGILIEKQSKERRLVSLRKFCIMCENLFKHQHTNECVLNYVELRKKGMTFSLNFPFDKLKERSLSIVNKILQPSSDLDIEKHLTSTAIRDFWISMSISDNDPEGIFPYNTKMKVKKGNNEKWTEVIFGADE
jgi:hypothetical protein